MIARLRRKLARRAGRIEHGRRMAEAAQNASELAGRLARARTILFVCLGNIIRSAFAAELLRVRSVGCAVGRIESAGLAATPDDPAHPGAVQCAQRFGVDLTAHRARRLEAIDIAEADLVLAMEIDHVVDIARVFPQHAHKAYLLGCFTAEEHLDVADPVYAPADVLEGCFARIDRAVGRIVAMLPPAPEARAR
jgi:low molecular weight protein-tyrosine phosphatase